MVLWVIDALPLCAITIPQAKNIPCLGKLLKTNVGISRSNIVESNLAVSTTSDKLDRLERFDKVLRALAAPLHGAHKNIPCDAIGTRPFRRPTVSGTCRIRLNEGKFGFSRVIGKGVRFLVSRELSVHLVFPRISR